MNREVPTSVIVISVLLALVVGIWAALYFGVGAIAHIHTGNGEHIGYVVATSCGGLFFKTCHLYYKTDTAQSQEDAYCITDPAIVQQADHYAETHTKVRISFDTYNIWAKGCAWDAGGGDMVTAITPV